MNENVIILLVATVFGTAFGFVTSYYPRVAKPLLIILVLVIALVSFLFPGDVLDGDGRGILEHIALLIWSAGWTTIGSALGKKFRIRRKPSGTEWMLEMLGWN